MIFDQVTDAQMQAARAFGGATMVALLAAPLFRHWGSTIRMVVAGIYITGALGFSAYLLM